MLLQYVQLCGKLWDHQHGTPSQCLLAAQDVPIYVVPNIQNLHKISCLVPQSYSLRPVLYWACDLTDASCRALCVVAGGWRKLLSR